MSDRRAMLAKVHLAKKDLALQDDSYRAVVQRITGCDSSAKCSDQQLHLLLAEFTRLGWKARPGRAGKPRSQKPFVRMIYGIWREMAPLLADPSDTALRSFVQRQTRSALHPHGVEAPEFLDAAQATRVIEGLKAWRTRLQAGEAG